MTKSRGIGRGGSREGAGRKAVDGATITASLTVKVDEGTAALLYELGEGNYSLGARRAVAELLSLRHQPVTYTPPALQPISKQGSRVVALKTNPFMARVKR